MAKIPCCNMEETDGRTTTPVMFANLKLGVKIKKTVAQGFQLKAFLSQNPQTVKSSRVTNALSRKRVSNPRHSNLCVSRLSFNHHPEEVCVSDYHYLIE